MDKYFVIIIEIAEGNCIQFVFHQLELINCQVFRKYILEGLYTSRITYIQLTYYILVQIVLKAVIGFTTTHNILNSFFWTLTLREIIEQTTKNLSQTIERNRSTPFTELVLWVNTTKKVTAIKKPSGSVVETKASVGIT